MSKEGMKRFDVKDPIVVEVSYVNTLMAPKAKEWLGKIGFDEKAMARMIEKAAKREPSLRSVNDFTEAGIASRLERNSKRQYYVPPEVVKEYEAFQAKLDAKITKVAGK